MIFLVGTSHIAKESIEEIHKAVATIQPTIIAVELDRGRAHALLEKNKQKSKGSIRQLGVTGYFFAVLGRFVQQQLGQKVGIEPGAEMKVTLELAQQLHLPVAFIDQDIAVTLRRLSQTFTYRERWNFVVDFVKGIIHPSKEQKELAQQFKLEQVPPKEMIATLLEQLQHRYPTLYKVLVEERNVYMAKRLKALQDTFPEARIVAVVGAGHRSGMESLLSHSLQIQSSQSKPL